MSDDYLPCPICGADLDWADCSECDGEGWFDAYELNPIEAEPGEMDACHLCQGDGGWYYCGECQRSVLRRELNAVAAPVAERPADTPENLPNSCSEPTDRPASVANEHPSPDRPQTATGAHG